MEINNLAIQFDLPNYETSVCEILTETGGTKIVTIIAEELTAEELVTYGNYVSMFAEKASVRVTNSDEQFCVERRTSFEVIDEVVEFNYASLSTEQQDILHNFYNLILSK
jgi:hypothetical protein